MGDVVVPLPVVPAWRTYLGILWRTFCVLSAAILSGAMAWDWFSEGAVLTNASNLGWLELGALLGAIAAAGWAFVQTPAVTALGKASRAAIQALLGSVFFTVVIDSVSDVLALEDLIVPSIITIVLAFVYTYLNTQGGVPQPSDTQIDPKVFRPMNRAA